MQINNILWEKQKDFPIYSFRGKKWKQNQKIAVVLVGIMIEKWRITHFSLPNYMEKVLANGGGMWYDVRCKVILSGVCLLPEATLQGFKLFKWKV